VGEGRVRRATPEDLPAVLELVDELDRFQHEWRVFPPRSRLRENIAERYEKAVASPDGEDLLVVAEDEGKIVGTAFGHSVIPSSFSDEAALELSAVVVRPSHRGRGIGAALSREVARFAVARGIRIVVLKTFAQNESALRFWQGVGFLPRMVQMYAPAEDLAEAEDPRD